MDRECRKMVRVWWEYVSETLLGGHPGWKRPSLEQVWAAYWRASVPYEPAEWRKRMVRRYGSLEGVPRGVWEAYVESFGGNWWPGKEGPEPTWGPEERRELLEKLGWGWVG